MELVKDIKGEPNDQGTKDIFLQVIEDSNKGKGAARKTYSNLLYLSYFMFELCHVNVWKLSSYDKTMFIVLLHLDLGFGQVFLAGFVAENGAEKSSLCHTFTHWISSIEDLSWQEVNGGSFMVDFNTYTSQQVEYEDSMQAFDDHFHFIHVCCCFIEKSKVETWRNHSIPILCYSSCTSFILKCKIDVRNSETSNLDTIIYINYGVHSFVHIRIIEKRSILKMEIILNLDQISVVQKEILVEEGV